MDELLTLINDAAANRNWIVLAIGVVLVVIPIVLKALGKHVPIIDTILPAAVAALKKLKPSTPPARPEDMAGLSNVVELKDAPKKEEK